MGDLTDIADQKTPGHPTEIFLEEETGEPSENQVLVLIGHRGAGAASGASGVANYSYVEIENAGDTAAAKTEAEGYFGAGSELSKMVVAAVGANTDNYPTLVCIPLASSDTDYGGSDDALTTLKRKPGDFVATCYDAMDDTLRPKLSQAAAVMSGAQRVMLYQFGTTAVAANRDTELAADLSTPDTEHFMGILLRDTGTGGNAPTQSLGEIAAACAARIAALPVPFEGLDDVAIPGILAPKQDSDHILVGADQESEAILTKGWTPLRVLPNGDVAFVKTVTSRISTDGTGITLVNSYQDVQDFMVLYFWRKTIATRMGQADIKNKKASSERAQAMRGEVIRLAGVFEDQEMFQGVAESAKDFKIQRNARDRGRFDILTPVDVTPVLHTTATKVVAGTRYDVLTV